MRLTQEKAIGKVALARDVDRCLTVRMATVLSEVTDVASEVSFDNQHAKQGKSY